MNLLHHLFFQQPVAEDGDKTTGKKSKPRLLYSTLITPCLLFVVGIVCELLSIAIMYSISSLLVSFSSNQMQSFLYNAAVGLGVVSCQALATAYRTFLRDSFALQLRVRMTSVLLRLQEDYILGTNPTGRSSSTPSSGVYGVGGSQGGHSSTNNNTLLTQRIAGVDQRMSQDIVDCTERIAQLYEKLIMIPFIICFYSYYLVQSLGLLSVGLCLAYFCVGFSTSKLFTPNIVKYTIYLAQFEGFARSILLSFVQNYATISLLHGGVVELRILQSCLQQVFLSRKTMIDKELQLRCTTMWFAYTGSIVSYLIVGVSLLVGGSVGDAAADSDWRLRSWSRGSYACISLINAFTQCLDMLTLYSESRGYYLRIQSLVEVLEGGKTQGSAEDAQTWWSRAMYAAYLLANVVFFPVLCVARRCRRQWRGSQQPRGSFGNGDMIDMATLYSTHSVLNDDEDDDDEFSLQDDVREEQVEEGLATHASSTQKQRQDTLKTWKQRKGLILHIEKHSVYSLPTTLGNRKLLIRQLSTSLHQGQRILITGPTGCGKSTLLAYIAQLLRFYYEESGQEDDAGMASSAGSPQVKHTHNTPRTAGKYQTVICSQVPYILPQGTLRDNLCYPFLDAMRNNGTNSPADTAASSVVFNIQRAKWALEECALDHLVHLLFSAPTTASSSTAATASSMGSTPSSSCCDCLQSSSDVDYSYRHQASNMLVEECERLSTGQRQCLAMARLLYHANTHTIALLDEISSGMDEETEHKIYTSLMIHVNTFISVGHRSSIRSFHTHELRIFKDCSFKFEEISPFSMS